MSAPATGLEGASALVCGGAGFIGSHLVDGLLDAGAGRVLALDDFSLGREENLATGLERPQLALERVDCRDLAALERAVGGEAPFDLCFNLAVVPLPASLERPRENVDDNVAMTTAVCELGRAGRYRRLVQFSSSEAYGTALRAPMDEDHPLVPTTPYAASKAATDLVALSYGLTFGLEVTVVRPFNTYGPRQNDAAYAGLIPVVVGNVLRGEPVSIHGDGEQTRDYCYVSDTVTATLAAAISDAVLGRAINVGSGEEHTVNELIAKILGALERPDHPVVHGDSRPGDVRRLLADVSLARRLLGFTPTVELAEGMRRTVAWYLERDGARAA